MFFMRLVDMIHAAIILQWTSTRALETIVKYKHVEPYYDDIYGFYIVEHSMHILNHLKTKQCNYEYPY
jgi:hypothetical protein